MEGGEITAIEASHPLASRVLRIIRSQMGSSAGLFGAVRVASEAQFAPAFVKEWVMPGRPLAHPAFAEFLGQLARTGTQVPQPATPMPPAMRSGQEPQL